MSSCSRALSSGPWRPPLFEFTNTTVGHSAGSASSCSRTAAAAAASPPLLSRIASLMASRRYPGIVTFRRSSSLLTRTPASVKPRRESITDVRPEAELLVGAPNSVMGVYCGVNDGNALDGSTQPLTANRSRFRLLFLPSLVGNLGRNLI
ncbi:aspartyl/glutamyl-tRNA(Asn/Gln) amidotransferasesubunit C [Striga asiatica]|uniref:Aspartyl/glutamyl-tRNA(Asn/Gln) amidotransferasesubunit C n=1 Tax=Striga asiatica TaxID=4170 RepID=A0A5A7R5R4_STRAF|nr:aspartyl/glutamyl-tRNA(Asn/Gln) amidotransferasesubunit C [Striga asiatica]